jgi:hypothetical protein
MIVVKVSKMHSLMQRMSMDSLLVAMMVRDCGLERKEAAGIRALY